MGVNSRNILLAGATGLVGGLALKSLLADPCFRGALIAPTRRDLGIRDPRLTCVQTDFSAGSLAATLASAVAGQASGRLDVFVSCLGTTIKTAGSREAFIAVDRELVLLLAQSAFDLGARHAVLVSSVGASRQSGNFYLRVKGEVEDAVAGIGFSRLDIIQPGLLLGARGQRRTGEAIAQVLAPVANCAMFGRFLRYRAIDAQAVGRAIAHLSGIDGAGIYNHQYTSIQAFAVGL